MGKNLLQLSTAASILVCFSVLSHLPSASVVLVSKLANIIEAFNLHFGRLPPDFTAHDCEDCT
jgi:hypothetical protein